MSISRRFRIGAAFLFAVVLGLLLPTSAAVAEIYGYSTNLIVDLKFSGATVFDHQSSSTHNVANYVGAGLDERNDPLDALQAKSGGGGFPPENHFDRWSDTGEYARADSMISGTGILGMSGANVAEGARSRPGRILGIAEVSFDFGLKQTTADPINISFMATPTMFAFAGRPGEFVGAGIDFKITFRRHGVSDPLLIWQPNGIPHGDYVRTEGVVTGVADPFSLNKVISADGRGFDGYVPGTGRFALSYLLAQGQEVDVEVKWSETISGLAVAVPEPSSTALMALGLVVLAGLGAARRRGSSRMGDYPHQPEQEVAHEREQNRSPVARPVVD